MNVNTEIKGIFVFEINNKRYIFRTEKDREDFAMEVLKNV